MLCKSQDLCQKQVSKPEFDSTLALWVGMGSERGPSNKPSPSLAARGMLLLTQPTFRRSSKKQIALWGLIKDGHAALEVTCSSTCSQMHNSNIFFLSNSSAL